MQKAKETRERERTRRSVGATTAAKAREEEEEASWRETRRADKAREKRSGAAREERERETGEKKVGTSLGNKGSVVRVRSSLLSGDGGGKIYSGLHSRFSSANFRREHFIKRRYEGPPPRINKPGTIACI